MSMQNKIVYNHIGISNAEFVISVVSNGNIFTLVFPIRTENC